MNTQIYKLPDFDNHKLVVYVNDNKSGLRGFIAVHRGNAHIPSFGATRYWNYKNDDEALNDALRLSRTMSYKSALAGLNYGGAKATLIKNVNSQRNHKSLLKAYADKVNYLNGRFVTGTDVGITDEDVKTMRRYSKFFVGVNSDPARFTALGVFYSIDVCVKEIFGSATLSDRTFAIKGLGKTGGGLLKLLYPHTKNIFVADINKERVEYAKNKYPAIQVIDPEEIDKYEVDVFCPCALGNAINTDNISKLKCRIICGSANNQLETDKLGEKLYKLGILYAPDYVVNAAGLISVVDEYENNGSSVSRISQRVKSIKTSLKKVLEESKRKHIATNLIANEMAEENFNNSRQ